MSVLDEDLKTACYYGNLDMLRLYTRNDKDFSKSEIAKSCLLVATCQKRWNIIEYLVIELGIDWSFSAYLSHYFKDKNDLMKYIEIEKI